jgi:Raf kinase inhibitor-like YbhB/YbcL family protein
MSRPPLRRFAPALGLVGALALAAGCGTSGRDLRAPIKGANSPARSTDVTTTLALPLGSAIPGQPFAMTSTAFTNGGAIPSEFACEGESPPLAWSNLPEGTQELELAVVDPNAGNYVHWLVTGIPVTVGGVAQGGVPGTGTQHENSAGKAAYSGPCPPAGSSHAYQFILMALPQTAGLSPNVGPTKELEQLEQQANGHLAILNGTYPGPAGAGGSIAAGGTETTTTAAPTTTAPS